MPRVDGRWGVKAAVLHAAGDIRVEDVDDARIEQPTDVVVRVTHAAVCGSDLHPYRARFGPPTEGRRPGHEFLGVVDAVGADVATVRVGDTVLAPFAISDGTCAPCSRGEYNSCDQGSFFGGDDIYGGQAEAVRVPFADGTLWPVPEALREDEILPGVLLLGDVAGTGEHAARIAGVTAGDAVVVLGDGAVGLCATIAARRRDPRVLIVVGHHADRLELAKNLGADVVINGRDGDVSDRVREAGGGELADAVLETVGGGQGPVDAALELVRDFGRIGSVGVFDDTTSVPAGTALSRNLRFAAGLAPTRAYADELGALLAAGEIDPRPVLTHRLPIARTDEAYRLMDQREAIKVLLTP